MSGVSVVLDSWFHMMMLPGCSDGDKVVRGLVDDDALEDAGAAET